MLSLLKRWTGGRRTWLPCGGTLPYAPTPLAGTPFSFLGRIILHKQPQGLGNTQKPHHDIAYLLIWVEDTKRDRHYSISLVWVHPDQVRVATMEEAVEKLTTFTSSGANWPYALAQLCKDPHHAPLPKNKHLGILPQERCRKPCVGGSANLKSINCLLLVPKSSTL